MKAEPETALICQKALALRWDISVKTLERWRWKGLGPRYLKIGRRVRYDLNEIERFEAASWRAHTSDEGAAND